MLRHLPNNRDEADSKPAPLKIKKVRHPNSRPVSTLRGSPDRGGQVLLPIASRAWQAHHHLTKWRKK
jgi:hypothetical protein